MAKHKGPSLLGIFKQYFADHPEWLRIRGNDAVIALFAKDHPKIQVDQRVKQAMFNAKNHMRKGRPGRVGRKQKVAEITAAMNGSHAGSDALQVLENHVDECLAMARAMHYDSIREVVGQPRRHQHQRRFNTRECPDYPVRRLISRFSRASGLFVRIRVQCSGGKLM